MNLEELVLSEIKRISIHNISNRKELILNKCIDERLSKVSQGSDECQQIIDLIHQSYSQGSTTQDYIKYINQRLKAMSDELTSLDNIYKNL